MSTLLRLLALSLVLVAGGAFATSREAATEQVRARLVASAEAVQPGGQIVLGLQQRIIPHWHTYWANPGDSGIATSIAWNLPHGAEAGDIQWPVPKRFALGPVTNYGYEGEVTLLSAIQVPADAPVGGTFPVRATASWLVCREICLPQEVELALNLPVVLPGMSTGRSDPAIEKARAALPVASPWPVTAVSEPDGVRLRIAAPELGSRNVRDIWFYPSEWGRVAHNAPQARQFDDEVLQLELRPGESPAKPGQALSGVLVVTEGSGEAVLTRGFEVRAVLDQPSAPSEDGGIALWSAVLLAVLGGAVLNLMPCVFPVLSIKALSLLKNAGQSPAVTRLHGLAYTLGVLASFACLAGTLIVLKAGGAKVGWGFQFQSPLFVLAVAYLVFAVGLSLSGVFSFGAGAAGIGSSLAERPGYAGSFFTGVLATVVATPCTAPFMGAAVGYALAQPPGELLAVFLGLGFGLALPYLLLSVWPGLQRRLPRPGPWMERVKQGMAFPMYGAAIWLVWVLAQQAGPNAVLIALAGMLAIALGAWAYQWTRFSAGLTRHGGAGFAALTLALALGGGFMGIRSAPAAAKPLSSGKSWEAYTPERLQALRDKGAPVFLNLTAAWCISCLANEKVALSDDSVAEAFRHGGITYLKGDWTNQDHEITRMLSEFGRSGVPLYVFYPRGVNTKPVVLPQLLTPAIVLSSINQE